MVDLTISIHPKSEKYLTTKKKFRPITVKKKIGYVLDDFKKNNVLKKCYRKFCRHFFLWAGGFTPQHPHQSCAHGPRMILDLGL